MKPTSANGSRRSVRLYAAKLYEKDSKTKKLLVVHVDKVVERTKPAPPPVEARDPVEVDFIKSRRWNN